MHLLVEGMQGRIEYAVLLVHETFAQAEWYQRQTPVTRAVLVS